MGRDCTQEREKVIQINEGAIRDHLGALVRSTVEETLNGMLDAEANRLCNAEKYQRSGCPYRHPCRALSSEIAHDGGRGNVEGSEASTADV